MSKYNGLCYDEKEKSKYESYYNNNCYTYAIGQPINPYTNEPYEDYAHCQPGNLGGIGCNTLESRRTNGEVDANKILKLAKEDLLKLGYEIIESTYEEYLEDGDCWKVALCCCSEDYHWYRQNVDGTWSAKEGVFQITNLDNDRKIIYDPKKCNRGQYVDFIGYYIIKKINQN